jgi:hypothetical protein
MDLMNFGMPQVLWGLGEAFRCAASVEMDDRERTPRRIPAVLINNVVCALYCVNLQSAWRYGRLYTCIRCTYIYIPCRVARAQMNATQARQNLAFYTSRRSSD